LKKPVGNKGAIRYSLLENFENLQLPPFIFLIMEGCHVPFKLKHHKGDLLTIEEVLGPELARKYSGKQLYLHIDQFDKSAFPEKTNPLTALESYTIKSGSFEGKIVAIHEYPKQILAELEVNGKTQLVPLHENLISQMDHEHKQIEMELPEGIFDL